MPDHAPPTDPTPDDADDPSRIDLARRAWIHRDAVRYTFSRASGPGGQSVNKVNTRAELRIAVTAIEDLTDAARHRVRQFAGSRLTRADEIVIAAATFRSQLANRRACLERLRELVARAEPEPVVRRKKRLSRAMKERRLQDKRQRSERKQRRRWRPGD